MNKLKEKVKAKVGIVVFAVIVICLLVAITSMFIGNSNKDKSSVSPAEGNIVVVDVQKPAEEKSTPKVEIQPIVTNSPVVNEKSSQEVDQKTESKQTEALVNSIQEGQPKLEGSQTPTVNPTSRGDIADKSAKPTYKEQDINPLQSQPKTGDKNDKGQIWIDGFGWVKDNGGGSTRNCYREAG